MRYTFRQLEYFIAAAETGSILLASERVNISPSSISTAVAHLEQELGVQLFVRVHAQGLALTPTGRLLLCEAKRVLDQAESLYVLASEVSGLIRGRLIIGCFVTLAPMVLPELTHSFTAAFPATELEYVVSDHETLMGSLRRAEIDLAITYDLGLLDGIDFMPLATLPAHVLVGEGHAFADRSRVSLPELAEQPLILLDLPISRDYFFALFAKEGLVPRIGARIGYQEVVRTMVANGYGYTLANVRPRSELSLDGRGLVRIDLVGDHRPMILGLAASAQLKKSKLREAFESHCRVSISDVRIPGMAMPIAQTRANAHTGNGSVHPHKDRARQQSG